MSKLLSLNDLIVKLYDVEGLLFGDFKVRTGESCPVYINMRVIWSYPDIVRTVSEMMWDELQKLDIEYDKFLGLPYQGIPLATYLSTKYDVPMLMKRQQLKTYGTKKLIEGAYRERDRVVLLDDVIMTGGTLVEDIPVLKKEGLDVKVCVCFFDRVQGGSERVKHTTGVETVSVFTLPSAMQILVAAGRITQETMDRTVTYIRDNRFDTPTHGVPEGDEKPAKMAKIE